MRNIVMILLVISLYACENAEDNIEILGTQADIVGTWVENGYVEDLTVLERADVFDADKYGFTLNPDGTFREHKNAGWCATPPITYENYKGEWQALSDSIIEITVGFWGGTMSYLMHIVSLDADTLKIRFEFEE